MEEMQQHQGEWFFLHELNVDKVFSTIQRADYLILYYIKLFYPVCQAFQNAPSLHALLQPVHP